jgi:hypothetical protein
MTITDNLHSSPPPTLAQARAAAMSTTTATKERPILFSASMVRAILDDQKTQTRRVVKMPPNFEQFTHLRFAQGAEAPENTFIVYWLEHGKEECGGTFFSCPYGKPGDRLWVRETHCMESSKEVAYDPPFNDGRPIRHHDDEHWGPWWEQPHYRATDPTPELGIGTGDPGVKWRPSIFMPRWASRITLEITAVRVERLQNISDNDARAEGYDRSHAFPCEWFAQLWERINGPGSWKANPWVWVVEFRKVQP